MKEIVRVGIIGPSWWVNYWHLAGLKHHPNARIIAVCGTKERSESDNEKYGEGVLAYTDFEKMLDEVPLDGVIVCTPNYLHHAASMAALKRGIAVICEKPIAMNAYEAKEMAETAERLGVVGMVNFPYRDNPNVIEFRKLVQSGYVGKILHLSGVYHGGFGSHRPPGWRGNRHLSGAGILGDLGSHLIDLARYVTELEFSSVCAHHLTLFREEDSPTELIRTEDEKAGTRNDDSSAFLAEFVGGAQGVFQTSWLAYQGSYSQHQELEVFGTEGRLHFMANHSGTSLEGMREGLEKTFEVFDVKGAKAPDDNHSEEDTFRPGRNSKSNTTYRWVEAIASGQKTCPPDMGEGLKTQLVIDTILKSSENRRWEDIPQN